jgi:hypothetical protein
MANWEGLKQKLFNHWWVTEGKGNIDLEKIKAQGFTIAADGDEFIIHPKGKQFRELNKMFPRFKNRHAAEVFLKGNTEQAAFDLLQADFRDGLLQQYIDIARKQMDQYTDEVIDTILHDPIGMELRMSRRIGKEDASGKRIFQSYKTPTPLHARRLDVPDELIWDYLERNPVKVFNRYSRRVLPELHLHDQLKKAGYTDLEDVYRRMKQDFRKAHDAAEGKPELQKRINYEEQAVLRDIDYMADRVRGIDMVEDPDSLATRWTSNLLKFNTLKYMTQAVISNIPDLASPIFLSGMRQYGRFYVNAFKNISRLRIEMKELERIGVAVDHLTNNRLARLTGVDPTRSTGQGMGGALEGTLDTAVSYFGSFSLMNPFNSFAKKLAGINFQDLMIRDGLELLNGAELNAHRKGVYARAGLTESDLRGFAHQFKQFGERIDGLHYPVLQRWQSEELSRKFQVSLLKMVDIAVITPRVGNSPLILDKNLGKIFLQFRQFTFNAMPGLLMANLQNADKEMLAGLVVATFAGGLSYTIRQTVNGREIPEDPNELLINAIDRSGVFAYLMDMNMVLERASAGNLGINPLLGGTELSRYRERDIGNLIFGPTYKTAQDVMYTFQYGSNQVFGEEIPEYQRQAFYRMALLSNTAYFRGLMEAWKAASGGEE